MKRGSYLADSHTLRVAGEPIGMNSKPALNVFWYNKTKYRDQVDLVPIRRIAWISVKPPPEGLFTDSIRLIESRSVTIDWLTFNVYYLGE